MKENQVIEFFVETPKLGVSANFPLLSENNNSVTYLIK